MNVSLSPPAPAAATPVVDAAPTAEGGIDGQTLLRARRRLAAAGTLVSRAESLAAVTEVLRGLRLWDYLALVAVSADTPHGALEGLVSPASGLSRSLQEQLLASGRQAIGEQRTTSHRAHDPDGWIVAAPAPAVMEDRRLAVVGLSSQAAALKPASLLLLECAADEAEQGELRRRLQQSELDLAQTAAVVELCERLSRTASPEQLDQKLVGELAEVLSGCRVLLGRRDRPDEACRITASAGGDAAAASGDDAEQLAAVMDEALMRGRPSGWPAESAVDEAGLLLHRQFSAGRAGRWVVTLPLTETDSEGAVLLATGDDATRQSAAARFLRAAAGPLAAIRETGRLARLSPWRRWGRAGRRWLGNYRMWVWLAVAASTLAAMAIPVPHRVECDCDLEPVVRQFIAAPFDAPLEAALVRPGDEVAAGDVLARLDGRELRWELAGVTAELQRAARERDGHMAEHDSGAARLSELEMERLTLQTRLLEHRTTQLEIRSPVAGLVIGGDLEQAIGAPLETGQTMFELAPVDRLIVELKIPERDVPYCHAGQAVRFWLESQPDEPRTGVIDRITPRAEVEQGESVFIAETAVENREGWLRPGMHGTARIDVGTCRLGWRLFHRAWEETRVWIGM